MLTEDVKLMKFKVRSMVKYTEDVLGRKSEIRNKVSKVLENCNWV